VWSWIGRGVDEINVKQNDEKASISNPKGLENSDFTGVSFNLVKAKARIQ
jgi:hypothetical protein